MPDDARTAPDSDSRDYDRIARAIAYVTAHAADRPSLDDIAAAVHTSPFHLQRLFTRWAGVSPAQFLRALTHAHAQDVLARSTNMLDAAWDAGLSGPGRLHDLFVTLDGVTPAEARGMGAGILISWGVHDRPYGPFVAGTTARGICLLEFVADDEEPEALVRNRWPGATLVHDPGVTADMTAPLSGNTDMDPAQPIRLWARGTNFQLQIWRALLRIPEGALTTYSDIARRIGQPAAHRAVANAVAANPAAVLIPCHRVIRATGVIETNYRWGTPRKLALVGRETAGSTSR
jgi:AraC family transcriptional regulator of adaptative response/methylated-DNA-[protein]-cysteine methyltransferase